MRGYSPLSYDQNNAFLGNIYIYELSLARNSQYFKYLQTKTNETYAEVSL